MDNINKFQNFSKNYIRLNSTKVLDSGYNSHDSININIFICYICWMFICHGLRSKAVQNAHKYLIVYIFLPLLILLTILLYVFKNFVNLYLLIKHKSKYRGMLESSDAVWATEDISKISIINVVLTVKTAKGVDKFIKDFKESIQKNYFANPNSYPKLTSTLETFLGYNFLLASDFDISECVSIQALGENVLQNDVETFIGDYSKQKWPKNNKILWEIVFIKSNMEEVYIIIRISHIVGDGFSLINLFVDSFTDQKRHFTFKPQLVQESICEKLLKYSKILVFSPAILFYQNLLRPKDENLLHPPKLSGKKIFVSVFEKDQKLIQTIKRIKRKLPQVTFMEILLTAFSASFDTYFKRKCSIVNRITTALPILGIPPKSGKSKLKNLFSIALLNIPVFIKPNSLLVRLNEVKKEVNILKKSLDYQVNYLLVSYFCGLIPNPVLNYMLNMNLFTMTLSNMPGIPKVSVLNGNVVTDVVFFTPQRGTQGVGFTVLTYDSRFQLGLSIDEAIISSRDECKQILADVFKNIELLQKEVFRL